MTRFLIISFFILLVSSCNNKSQTKVITHVTEGVELEFAVPNNFEKFQFWVEGSMPCDRAYYRYGHNGYPMDTTFISKLDSLFQLSISVPQSYVTCQTGDKIDAQLLNSLAYFSETKMNNAFNFKVKWNIKEIMLINNREFAVLSYTHKPTRSNCLFGQTVEAVTQVKDNLVVFSFVYEGNQELVPFNSMMQAIETIRITD
jgi:hypothetical protein